MDKVPDQLGQIQKRICSGAMISALALALVFSLLQEKAIARGLVLGTSFSIINFFLLGKSLPLLLGKSRAGASLVGLTSLLSRFILLAIPMIVAIKSTYFDFVAAVVGIFAVQIVTLFDYVVIKPIFFGKQGF